MKRGFSPCRAAAEIALRGLQLVCVLLFCTLALLLYTETADFQVQIALLHGAGEFCSIGSAALLLTAIGSIIVQDRLGR